MLEAVEKGLEAAGYSVDKLGRKTANVRKDGRTQKVAIRTSRDRWVGSNTSGGALHRSDIDAFAIGAVDSYQNPSSIEVYLIPRTEFLRRWEARRAGRRDSGYVVNGPTFIALDRLDGNDGLGSGLADEFKPIAEFTIAGHSADQPLSADDIKVIDTAGLGVDSFKRDVIDSAAKWLRFDPTRVKIDIHITIDT